MVDRLQPDRFPQSRERSSLGSGRDSRDALQWFLFVFLFIAIGVIAVGIWFWSNHWGASSLAAILIASFGSAILAIIPALLSIVQNASRRRQHDKLMSLEELPVAKTIFFAAASNNIASSRQIVDRDYSFPIFLFSFITFLGSMTICFAFANQTYFDTPIAILSGLSDLKDIRNYQATTFVVVTMAFIGSYVYAISRLIDRINNNDLYPLSLYYYVTRIITACAIAAVLRHTITLLAPVSDKINTNLTDSLKPLLILIGFAIGFAPDQFILVLTRRAFQAVKTWGTRDDPEPPPKRPTSLPLLMIDDLTREKIDRLNELGIDSAQMLARQNPFILLPRLPFDLGLLIDWIAQAQLYVLVKEDGLSKLRAVFVRDIFDLYIRLKNEISRAALCATLGISEPVGQVLIEQLEKDASFIRLKEIREALRGVK